MDTDAQLHEMDATGWQRGLYEDVQRTFRAPFVNWIFRTAMANEPAFLRYAWGQMKPLFETRAFARLSVDYRDAVLTSLEADGELPTYRRSDAGVTPAEYAELRGQLATFDVVAPRLAVLFEAMDRALYDGDVGTDPAMDLAATAPFPDWLDRDRGRKPSIVSASGGERERRRERADATGIDDSPDELAETVERIREFHGLGDALPSIYRCLAQWPTFTARLWDDLEPRFEAAGFDRACERTGDVVDEFVTAVPYRPRLAPDELAGVGFEEATVEDARELFRTFNSGPVETVLPALPVYAATVGSEGERSL